MSYSMQESGERVPEYLNEDPELLNRREILPGSI